jgi:hypothetical protein
MHGETMKCYQTCLSTRKELLIYFNYECISLRKYNVLLCEILGLCLLADEVSVLLGFGDAAVGCGTIVYVGNPYPIPVTRGYIPEEWRAGSLTVWRLEGSVKYQYLALSSNCLVTVTYLIICGSSNMV